MVKKSKNNNNFDYFSLLIPYPNHFLVVSLKMWVLCDNDMKFGNVCSIAWEKLPESVNIFFIWTLKMCLLLSGITSLKV